MAESPNQESAERKITFNADIRPIFAEHCVACHGGVKQASGLSFIYRDRALAEAESGLAAIVPGDPDNSYLVERVSDTDPESRMPPAEHGPALSEREISLLRIWIAQGAEWEEPWAFEPPVATTPPEVDLAGWNESGIDRFIAARLLQEGLRPSPPATRAEWLRRVSFDVIGLPPSAEELEAFEKDNNPDAHERVVDRLLASPHFGERWASVWLDLARYADTMGYEKDLRRDIWPYRDWLIRAFNADMPYDQFTIKQLAGDLLENPTLDDRIATAFHRNTQTNTEGGTDDEEFRLAAVMDRVNTTWQVWQATTFGCTQCHSHPYDPIEHEEYYKFLAVWNTTRDCDLQEEYPTLAVPTDPNQYSVAADLDRRLSMIRRAQHAEVMKLVDKPNQWGSLQLESASSTGQTQLEIHPQTAENPTELVALGTLSAYSRYEITADPPANSGPITALRIEVLPRDAATALRIPEMGFVVSRLTATLTGPQRKEPVELKFRAVFCDEPEPILDPAGSLRDNDPGWGDYPRLSRPHWAVFVFDKPLEISDDDQIELRIEQSSAAVGDIALVIQRGRFATTDNPKWHDLINSPKFANWQNEIARLSAERAAIHCVNVPIMAEQPNHLQRHTHVFVRGNWLEQGDHVEPGTPAVLPSLPAGSVPNRLSIARWIVAPENPLTARVLVNRVWEQLFGTGIVATAEDFGTSGEKPSHPELLDFLALRFQNELGLRWKKLLREVVLSSTYRQSSRVTPELWQRDPSNRLLSRGPRQRLRAEMVRDQALVLSGIFSAKFFGPPVMPPQPEGIWRSVYSDEKWTVSPIYDRNRRAIYVFWKRTSGYPSMMAFDVPTREVCTARRIATNSPLQALVTLNDPVFIEAAQGLARRMIESGGTTTEERIAWAYKLATCRDAEPAVGKQLQQLYNKAVSRFQEDESTAQALGDSDEEYGMTIVAHAILNLDEVLTK